MPFVLTELWRFSKTFRVVLSTNLDRWSWHSQRPQHPTLTRWWSFFSWGSYRVRTIRTLSSNVIRSLDTPLPAVSMNNDFRKNEGTSHRFIRPICPFLESLSNWFESLDWNKWFLTEGWIRWVKWKGTNCVIENSVCSDSIDERQSFVGLFDNEDRMLIDTKEREHWNDSLNQPYHETAVITHQNTFATAHSLLIDTIHESHEHLDSYPIDGTF